MTTNAQTLAEMRSKEAAIALIPTAKSKNSDEGDRQITMTELLAAYALYKSTLDKGVITQSQTMSTLFKVQDKSMDLAKAQMDKMTSEMEKSAKEQDAAGWLSKIGMIAGIFRPSVYVYSGNGSYWSCINGRIRSLSYCLWRPGYSSRSRGQESCRPARKCNQR